MNTAPGLFQRSLPTIRERECAPLAGERSGAGLIQSVAET